MKKQTLKKNFTRGVTMLEVTLAATITSMVLVSANQALRLAQHGMASQQAHTALTSTSQKALNEMASQLAQSARIFRRTDADLGYLLKCEQGPAASYLAPVGDSSGNGNTRLPLIEENGSLSPTSANFVPASVANSLFFAGYDAALDAIVKDVGGADHSIRLDTYHFTLYYLSEDPSATLGGQPRLNLWEWKSECYVDWQQLENLKLIDGTAYANAATELGNRGIAHAWKRSETDVDQAFYICGQTTAEFNFTIAHHSSRNLVSILSAVALGGFRAGVSPNTSGSFSTAQPVPQFATGADKFPSGLEVIAVGPSSGRQIFLRLVMAAQGTFKDPIAHEATVLVNVRDVW